MQQTTTKCQRKMSLNHKGIAAAIAEVRIRETQLKQTKMKCEVVYLTHFLK